jgi:hypothetical protein
VSLTPPRYTPARKFSLADLQEMAAQVTSDEPYYLPALIAQCQAQARVLDRLRDELTAGDVFTTGIPSMFGERFVKVLDRLLREEGVTK